MKRHETTWRFDPFGDGSELIEIAATAGGVAVYKIVHPAAECQHETRELVTAIGPDAAAIRDEVAPPGSVQFTFAAMLDAFRVGELHGKFGEQAAYAFMLHWFGLLSGDVRPDFRDAFPRYAEWFPKKWAACMAESAAAAQGRPS